MAIVEEVAMFLRTTSAAIAASVSITALIGGIPALARIAPSAQDKQFLVQAHQGNLAEIAAGKDAQKKGKASTVRSIGELLVTDHTKLDNSLKRIARDLHVSLPSEPSADQKAVREKLAALSGGKFDRAWVKAMIKGHRAALDLGKKELRDGSSPEVKKAAESSAPVIQKHLDKLLKAQGELGIR